jgi:dipeptidyl aminopeptidase/acylaminoacyl peptidase
MRLSSALLIIAAVFAFSTVSSAQNAPPASGSSPAGAQTAAAERPMSPSAKRPMTFEDMMQMKRLGDTAVSPDGKWLAYSVTTVDLEKNTKTAELWLQAIGGASDQSAAPFKLGVGQPGDSGVQFAPDGHSVLFVSGRKNGQQIWIADFDAATGASGNARKLTAIATGADNAKWSPDSKSIVFTSAVYPDCPAISTADFATGNQCNAGRDKAAAASPVKAQIWTHLLYRHWDHYTGEKRSHLFLVSVGTEAMRDLNPGDVHDVPPFSLEGSGCGCDFSPDGKELAFTENPDPVPAISTSVRVFTLDLTNPAAKPVKVSTSAGGNFDPAYSPDGKWLAWRSQARAGYESDKFRLMLYDRERGSKGAREQDGGSAGRETRAPAGQETGGTKGGPAVRDLLPKFDNWVDEFAWGASSKQIAFVSGIRGEENIYLTGPASEAATQITRTGEFSNLHLLARADHPGAVEKGGIGAVIATVMRVNQPSEVALVSIGDTPENVTDQPGVATYNDSPTGDVTHLNDALLAQLDLPAMESFWFTAADKTKLEGFIIWPPGFDAAKKYPVKFLIHGGPQGNWGDDWSYRWNAELFAANGYVVIMINMRGSTGYGQAIVDGVNGDWGGKPFTDLMEGLDYAEQHYPFIDKDRECALGASYGGYMANWVLGHTNRFKCIVSHDGMFDAESAFGTTEEDWFNIWEFKFPNTQGGHPWDYYGKPDAENPYRKWSPSLYAKNFKTPTLVVHGQLDYRLDVSEGFQLFDTLQMLGVPSKMLYFPDEGHWVLKPKNSQLWWKTVNDWVDEWTKGRD